MLVPDALLGSRSIGKVLFSLIDTALGAALARLARGPEKTAVAVAWLANPVAIGICTRGSSDTVVAATVAAAACVFQASSPAKAGVLLGLGAHLKLYPIIHVPAFALNARCHRDACACVGAAILSTAATSLAAALAYDDYLNQAVVYHLRRVDHRHNFSPLWFPLYLALDLEFSRPLLGIVPFALQAVSQLATVACLARHDLPLCLFAQTMLFVAANKVSTAQYFVWWLPFAIVASAPGARKAPRRLAVAAAVWALLLGLWLVVAYALEFLGLPVHVPLFLITLVFFLSNVNLLVAVLRARVAS